MSFFSLVPVGRLLNLSIKSIVSFLFFISSNTLYAYNPEHLTDLRSKIAQEQPLECVEYNLERADLSGLNLRKANFQRSRLAGVNFSGCCLSKANFKGADLTGAYFTNANINGAIFRTACLADIQGAPAVAKGSLFADKTSLFEKTAYDNKNHQIIQSFLKGKASVVNLDGVRTIEEAYSVIYKNLAKYSCTEAAYTIFDFHQNPLEAMLFQDCLFFLSTPLFRQYVQKVIPICNNRAILCFFPERDSGSQKTSTIERKTSVLPGQTSSIVDTLDLHGKIPLDLKLTWVEEFIRNAYEKNKPYVYIITGRGLHNPHGKMGIFWKICKSYLKRRKFNNYIENISTISKNGGWKVVLKKKKKISRKKRHRPVGLPSEKKDFCLVRR